MTNVTLAKPKRERILIVIVGQSNESAVAVDFANMQAFQSIRNPAVNVPMPGSLTHFKAADGMYYPRGSMWVKCYDDLWDYGYDPVFFNGAVGSMSMISHACGIPRSWTALERYMQYRQPEGHGDRGHAGDFTVQNGNIFLCTTGNKQFAFYDNSNFYLSDVLATGSSFRHRLDYLTVGADSLRSGGSAPTWTSATSLGDTVTDGDIEWTLVNVGNTFGFTNGTTFSDGKRPFGFDPMQIVQRALDEGERLAQEAGVTRKIVLIQNGQSDLGQSATEYKKALKYVAEVFYPYGYDIGIGLSCYMLSASTSDYDALSTGRDAAVTELQAAWGSDRVFSAANLYQDMGTDIDSLLQTDDTHLNSEGMVVAGGYEADALKLFLPDRSGYFS